jgi:DNA-directed RNA polymerase specialized sigma24 family protein
MEIELKQYIKLVEDHARVAYHKIRKPSQHTTKDLVQEGVVVFLLTRKAYSSERGASFKTYLTMRLRQRFYDIIKKSYQHFKDSSDRKEKLERRPKNSVNPVEAASITFLLKKLTSEELEYTKTMLQLYGEKYFRRRKTAREVLGITYGREVKLRNSIRSKVRR